MKILILLYLICFVTITSFAIIKLILNFYNESKQKEETIKRYLSNEPVSDINYMTYDSIKLLLNLCCSNKNDYKLDYINLDDLCKCCKHKEFNEILKKGFHVTVSQETLDKILDINPTAFDGVQGLYIK